MIRTDLRRRILWCRFYSIKWTTYWTQNQSWMKCHNGIFRDLHADRSHWIHLFPFTSIFSANSPTSTTTTCTHAIFQRNKDEYATPFMKDRMKLNNFLMKVEMYLKINKKTKKSTIQRWRRLSSSYSTWRKEQQDYGSNHIGATLLQWIIWEVEISSNESWRNPSLLSINQEMQ